TQRGVGCDTAGGQTGVGADCIGIGAVEEALQLIGLDGQRRLGNGEVGLDLVSRVVVRLGHVGGNHIVTGLSGSFVGNAQDVAACICVVSTFVEVAAIVGAGHSAVIGGGVVGDTGSSQGQHGVGLGDGVETVGSVAGGGGDLHQVAACIL